MSDVSIDVRSTFDDSGLSSAEKSLKGLDREATQADRGLSVLNVGLGDLASNGIQAVISGAAQLGAKLFEIGQESAGLGSSAAETASLLDTVLGPSLESYESQIDAISKATGASTNQLKEGSKIFAVLADSAGFASEEVASLAANTANTALDQNSLFDKDNALEAIGQAYKGESDGLAQFGIDVRQAALLDTAYRNGILETGEALDKQSTILAVNAAIQEQAAAAMGDATKTAGGYANTQRAITGLTEDYKVALGEVVVAGLQPFQKSLLDTGQKFLPAFQKKMEESVDGVAQFSQGMVTLLEYNDELNRTGQQTGVNFVLSSFADSIGLTRSIDTIKDGISSIQELGLATEILAEKEAKLAQEIDQADSKLANFKAPIDEIGESMKETSSTFENAWGAIVEESETAAVGIGAVYGALANGSDSVGSLNLLGETIDSVSQKVVTLRDRAIDFSSNDYFATEVDETGLFGEVAQNLDGASVPLVVELLLEDGTPIDDVRATARELIESKIGAGLAESFNQGEISEDELISSITTLKAELEAVEDPLILLQEEAGILYDAINDLSQDFQSKITFSLDGLDELREAKSVVEFLAGQDLSALDANFEAFVPQGQSSSESIPEIGRLRN